jgi:hypothetical protein
MMFFSSLWDNSHKKNFLSVAFSIIGGLTAVIDPVQAEDIHHLGFKNTEIWKQWEKITFPRIPETVYIFEEESQTVCTLAKASASAITVGFPGTLEKYPILSWEWKINQVLKKGDARKKEGDDYAARIYINFERDTRLSWWERARARIFETFYGQAIPGQTLTFIWANQLKVGKIIPSPYTQHAQMVVLQSGNNRAGEWVRQEVNLLDWYQYAFKNAPPPVHSIAIMTDSDNTGETAQACFRNILLRGTHSSEKETP